MIDPLRLAHAINTQADDYGTKATDTTATALHRNMYGTASLVLYALSIALLDSIQPVLHEQAQKEHE